MLTVKPDKLSLKKLLGRVLRFREAILQITLLYILWSLIELSIPFLFKLIVDQGIGFQDFWFVLLVLGVQLIFFFGTTTADFFKVWLLRHIGVRMNVEILNEYFRRIIYQNILFFNKNNEGVLIQNTNDSLRIDKFLTEGLFSALNAIFKMVLFTALLFYFGWAIGLVFVASYLLILGYAAIFLQRRKYTDNLTFEAFSSMRGDLVEVARGIYDIKLNNLEDERISRWTKLQNRIALVRFKLLGIAQTYDGGTKAITQVRDLGILAFAALAVINGQMTLGTLIAIQYILAQSTKASMDTVQFIQEYQDARLSLGRFSAVFDHDEPDGGPRNPAGRHIGGNIRVEQVSYTYNSNSIGLRQIDLELPAGASIALVGESGSGKSTLLKLLQKLLVPDSGRIYIGNELLQHLHSHDWREKLSVVSQEGFLFDGTVAQNICLTADPAQVDQARLQRSVELACLRTVLEQKPLGLESPVGKNGQNFSKGQAQRILLARAFYKRADYAIFDEPTSALDNRTARQVVGNMLDHYRGSTLLMATHKLHLVQSMDLIVLMDEGRIKEVGNPRELLAGPSSFSELYQAASYE